jgi:hypothetical protein
MGRPLAPAYTHPPILVGGSGRSGTTVVARLLGRHPDYHQIVTEVGFHCLPGGITDAVEGRITAAQLLDNAMERFYYRGWEGGGRGLHYHWAGKELVRTVKRFAHHFAVDPVRAGRETIRDLLDPLPVEEEGKPGWVEMTPYNIRSAASLARLLPEARFVHVVRDGRDVGSSVVRLPWGPNDIFTAIPWWAGELRAADRASREIGYDRVHVLRLDELVGPRRDERYRELLAFCGLADDPGMRRYFDERITVDRANVGRWRRELDRRGRLRLGRLYQATLRRLRREGVACLPA